MNIRVMSFAMAIVIMTQSVGYSAACCAMRDEQATQSRWETLKKYKWHAASIGSMVTALSALGYLYYLGSKQAEAFETVGANFSWYDKTSLINVPRYFIERATEGISDELKASIMARYETMQIATKVMWAGLIAYLGTSFMTERANQQQEEEDMQRLQEQLAHHWVQALQEASEQSEECQAQEEFASTVELNDVQREMFLQVMQALQALEEEELQEADLNELEGRTQL